MNDYRGRGNRKRGRGFALKALAIIINIALKLL